MEKGDNHPSPTVGRHDVTISRVEPGPEHHLLVGFISHFNFIISFFFK